MILLLALAGAGVDAVMIIAFNVLTAAQTGNTILLAVAVAQGQLAVGISAAVSVIGYVVGAAVGQLTIIRHSKSRPGSSGIARPLIAECALLGCVIVLWHTAGPTPAHGMIATLVALAAVAMGIQSTAVLWLHAGRTTTYITGMLTTFTTGMIRWLVESTPPSGPPRPHPPAASGTGSGDGSWKYGVTWVVYAVGALVCGILFLNVGELALLVPIGALVAVAVFDSHGERVA